MRLGADQYVKFKALYENGVKTNPLFALRSHCSAMKIETFEDANKEEYL